MTSMGGEMEESVIPGKDGDDGAGKTFTAAHDINAEHYSLGAGSIDAAIPKGTLDPVYEAKAKVLNQAVRRIFLHVTIY